MTVRVKLFAAARELAGRDELVLELPATSTVGELRRAVVEAVPPLAGIVAHSMWAVDEEYAAEVDELTEQSRIALIPPVSGG